MSIKDVKESASSFSLAEQASISLEERYAKSIEPNIEEDVAEDDSITFPEGGTRAWLVAAGTSGALLCTMGYINAAGVFQEYYSLHQLRDQSPSRIAWIGSIQTFFLFASGLIGGPLFDRYGAIVIQPASAAYVLSIMLTSLCKEYYQFILAQGILGGVSVGLVAMPSMAATSQYFNKKRGAVMGLSIAGSCIGAVIFPVALGKMLENPRLGFGWSIRICGFIILVVLSLASFAIRARLPPRKNKFFLPSALKELSFLAVASGSFLLFLGMFTPMFYLPTYAIQHGMSESLAAYLVAIFNGASFPGRVIPGILADKLGRFNMLFLAGIATGVLNLCWPQAKTNASIIVISALFGFCSGAIVSGAAVGLTMLPKHPRDIGTYMGMGLFFCSFATLIGPPVNGILLTKYYGYKQVSILSGVVCLAGAFVVLLTKPASGKSLFSIS